MIDFINKHHTHDPSAILLLADLWEEQGHPLARTARWMAENNKSPIGIGGWIWCFNHYPFCLSSSEEPYDLPARIFTKLTGNPTCFLVSYSSFLSAVEALSEAL